MILCETGGSQTFLPFEHERFVFENCPNPCGIQVEFRVSIGFVASTWGTLQHITCKGTDTLHLFRYERGHWLSGPARSQRPNAVWCPELENLSHASQISLRVYTIIYKYIYIYTYIYIYMCNDVDECAVTLCLHMCNFFWSSTTCIHFQTWLVFLVWRLVIPKTKTPIKHHWWRMSIHIDYVIYISCTRFSLEDDQFYLEDGSSNLS